LTAPHRAATQVGPYIGDANNAVKIIGRDHEIVGFDCAKFVVQFKPPTFIDHRIG